jgi:two-component system KDP operon response regulator KdpE
MFVPLPHSVPRHERRPGMSGARVLVVDDELEITRALRSILTAHGFEPILAATAREGLDLLRRRHPDLLLLDLVLPDQSGHEVTRTIRQELGLDLPIIVLSAHGEEEGKVQALDLGADDYLTKPFGVRELLARMRAALRRAGGTRSGGGAAIEHGPIRMDLERHEVTVEGHPVHLTPKEYDMLQYLLTHVGRLVTHTALLRAVWGPEYADARPYLHVMVGQLRRKIEPDPRHPRYILTEPGVGYRLAELSD